uniref:Uncharacterized protein n=1 Tax=Magallana gigas TaxID=29159 RepID=A0A8W8P170_MAGGI
MRGYYRDNCPEKCSPPNYGEDCQSVCQCPDIDCHFVTGCFQNTGTLTYHWQPSSTREILDSHSALVTITVSNVTMEYESPLHSELEQQANLELTYRTPVFRNDEKSETNILVESKIVADIPIHNRQICSQTRDESKLTTDNLLNHVYIEILKDNIERTGVHEDSQSEYE